MDITRVNDGKDMKDIARCIICGRDLRPDRTEVDTCGKRCSKTLLVIQRRQLAVSADA